MRNVAVSLCRVVVALWMLIAASAAAAPVVPVAPTYYLTHFVGNILLKSIEATAEVVGGILRREILAHPSSRFGAWLLQGALGRVRRQTAYSSIGGALLLGVDGVVVVAHGRSDATAVSGAIAYAHRCATDDLVERIRTALRPA